jgi:hypothetical protein
MDEPEAAPPDGDDGTDASAGAPETADATDAAEAERQAQRLADAVAALDDDTLRAAVGATSEQSRNEIATTLQLPPATMHLGKALPPLLRRKLHAAPPLRQLTAAFALVEPVNDATVRALGAHHDDPSRDDMLAVLPGMVERFGTPLVTLMLAAYGASDAQCQAVFAELLESEEQFAIGPAIDDGPEPAKAVSATPAGANGGGPTDDARREERKAAKAARRKAQQHERAAQQAAHAARKEAQRRAKRGS